MNTNAIFYFYFSLFYFIVGYVVSNEILNSVTEKIFKTYSSNTS